MIQITLTPEQEQFLQAQLKTGKYNNLQEVISKAFKLLEKEEETEFIANIPGSPSAKKLLKEKIKEFRDNLENNQNQPLNIEQEKLIREVKELFDKTQSIPGIGDITEEEIVAEIEAYRGGE
ncbi:ribbon-helix-helix domain-containing protein [Planktothrix mougeotii]|uniref:Type II toxin-antitoxin system ParD family antitoxin n=1 Tax=Planktothrix mougeotii LEGE 06226 TaxID=1828728 RepID=A0ABR9UH16_9CYAN|nr:type II toxin-antitoxin system ParD family antitoxin [Planktothrix mougeotii]MBE9145760.1 type II toxin-antitoxin system ParD family antitoxin [Planktothrix mougeotii LEGE 06226]